MDPILYVPDISFGRYQIQLNLYQYLFRYGGYVPKNAQFKLYLNYVTNEHTKLVEVPDRQNEIKDMMIQCFLKYKKS